MDLHGRADNGMRPWILNILCRRIHDAFSFPPFSLTEHLRNLCNLRIPFLPFLSA
jgi:hypothetical protein